jgi:hypothetical protein
MTAAAGQRHTFVPSDKWSWFHPAILVWDQFVLDEPDTYAAPYAAFFCREHAALRPVSITFLRVKEKDFKPEDHLKGNRALDPEFTSACSGEVGTGSPIRTCARQYFLEHVPIPKERDML